MTSKKIKEIEKHLQEREREKQVYDALFADLDDCCIRALGQPLPHDQYEEWLSRGFSAAEITDAILKTRGRVIDGGTGGCIKYVWGILWNGRKSGQRPPDPKRKGDDDEPREDEGPF